MRMPGMLLFSLLYLAFAAGASAQTQSLFTTQTPALTGNRDGADLYELGMKFKADAPGNIVAIRFWKDYRESGIHVGKIYSASGTLLASVQFSQETASGWQTQNLLSPLAIQANTTYVVAVNTPNGYYVATTNGLASTITNGHLSSVVPYNGVFGPVGPMPTRTWNASNYFRDVVYMTGAQPADTKAPSVPTGLVGTVAVSVNLTWSPSTDNVGVVGYNIYRNGIKIGTSSTNSFVDSGTTPSTQYKYAVSAYDAAGNASQWSSEVIVTTPVANPPPTGSGPGCSGSGTSWACGAGTTSAQLKTALNNAADGATLTFNAGSYSWNSFVSFSNTKGVTLICAAPGSCNVAASGTVLGMSGNVSGTNNKFYRISGFTFNGGNMMIWFYGAGILQQVRIDHNTFNASSGSTVLFFGENSTVASFYGVIDHNTFSSSGSIAAFQYIGAVRSPPLQSPAGTANNLFFEDNTITITTMSNAGLGCIDGWGGNAIVYRYNKSTNCLVTTHGAPHAGGPPNIELYDNLITVNSGSVSQGFADCYRCFHHQGSGEFYAFNNRFTAYSGKAGTVIGMMDYRAYPNSIGGGISRCDGTQSIDGNRQPTATYRGYPCWHQPGRNFATSPIGGNLKPIYVWNNYWTDTLARVPMTMENLGGDNYVQQHMQADRDYYNSVSALAQTSPTSPFNGTTGMGFGTLSKRPTTCTTNSLEPGGGVGYFATDSEPRGTLYRCSSPNTWTAHYRPYAYPHTLVK